MGLSPAATNTAPCTVGVQMTFERREMIFWYMQAAVFIIVVVMVSIGIGFSISCDSGESFSECRERNRIERLQECREID